MTFDDFLPHVLPSVAGCPDLVARDHGIKAARIYCARTLVWNYSTNPIYAEAGIADYTLQIGDGQELVRVLRVEIDENEYSLPDGPHGRAAARRGVGNICVMKGAEDFTLSPAPQLDGATIITDIAVKPAFASTYWPDDFEQYVTDIASGAIASLCLIPRVEWSDAKLADTQQAIFLDRIGTVGMKVARGLGASKQDARVVWF